MPVRKPCSAKFLLLPSLTVLFALAAGSWFLAHASEPKMESMEFGGRMRTYALYVPASRDAARRVPLLIVLHGGAGNAERMRHLTRNTFDKLADRDGFVVVYPEGVGNSWNDGRNADPIPAQRAQANDGGRPVVMSRRPDTTRIAPPVGPVDDVGFISALIEHLLGVQNIDSKRVYVTGISNGAMMANRLGCELSDKIAAIAPVAGQLPANIAPTCGSGKTVSVLTINGTADPLVPYDGGEIRLGPLGRSRGTVLSTNETVKLWAKRNGCDATPLIAREATNAPDDGTTLRREFYPACRDGAEVMLVAVEGGGHAWPGGAQYLPVAVVGRASRQIDAAEFIWNFFRRHLRN